MTTSEPPALVTEIPAPPTRYDRWRSRIAGDVRLRRLYTWLPPVLITLLAGILRFWNLGQPHAIVFDETYYVKDAWSQWNLGYAATWPDGADAKFLNGHTDIFTKEGSFIVHPPLGKYLIGVGMALFGPSSSFGWRFSAALFGTACVLVLFFLAKALTRSIPFASLAAFLLAIDGLGIVMSRVALLDIFLTFFILLAMWFVVLDQKTHPQRLAAAFVRRLDDDDSPLPVSKLWGPILWSRPWLIAAGAAAGAASAVKWSGVWALAAIGIYVVVTDALNRRRLGVTLWPTDAVRQGGAAFVLLVPVAFVVYLASWTGWLTTQGGWGRNVAEQDPSTGLFSWVPLPLQSLWRYHVTIYNSMAGMTSPHSYMSPAWQWPILWRPTSMYYEGTTMGQSGCTVGGAGCVQDLYSMPNPIIWWASVIAVCYLVYRVIVKPNWQQGLVLMAIAATWTPWLFYPDRTIFQFYTVAIYPFMLIALVYAIRDVAVPRGATPSRRATGQRVTWVFLIAVTVISAFWYPLWSASMVPYEFFRFHNWLQSWI